MLAYRVELMAPIEEVVASIFHANMALTTLNDLSIVRGLFLNPFYWCLKVL